jgi:glycosyltransferase involved in cell wall biosynthesis
VHGEDGAFVPHRDTVVFVSTSRGIGGPARSLLTVLDHLSGDLDRVLFAPPGDLANLARSHGVAHQLPMPFDLRRRRRSRIRAATVLARYVRRHRRHIVAVHANGQSELNLAAAVMAIARTPIVMWAHTSKASPTAAILRPVWRHAGSWVHWLAVSETATATLVRTLGIPAGTVSIIPNPIDPSVASDPVPHDGVRVGYLGLATLPKGFDLLAPILRQLGRDDIGLDLYVAKPSPHTPVRLRRPWEELNQLSMERDVTLPGRIRNVARAYASCDIILCPSRTESFGRVVAEAMMNGLPVVTSDIPAHRQLVGGSGGGRLFPDGDAAAAAAAIQELADDPRLRREMGERGRRYVQRFTPERVVPRLEACYRGGPRSDT